MKLVLVILVRMEDINQIFRTCNNYLERGFLVPVDDNTGIKLFLKWILS